MVRHTGENLVDEEGVAVTLVFSLQSPGVQGTGLNASEPDSFAADRDAALG
jgi:hypothetical protein